MNMIDFIKSIGWHFKEYWNNRAVYELGQDSFCSYYLFEHQGDIGIIHNEEYYYYNLNKDDISKLTDVLKERLEMFNNPKDYTLYQAQQNSLMIEYLINKLEEKRRRNDDK